MGSPVSIHSAQYGIQCPESSSCCVRASTFAVLAWIRLVLGIAFIVVGSHALFSFYCSRWILDIRTRLVPFVNCPRKDSWQAECRGEA